MTLQCHLAKTASVSQAESINYFKFNYLETIYGIGNGKCRQGFADSMRKDLGFSQQKVSALSELFRRSYRVPCWLAGEPIITVRHEGDVDRKQRPVSALVA